MWIVIRLKPGKAQLAEFHLHRQMFDTFYPMIYEVSGKVRKRFRWTPMFPGYMFVSILSNDDPVTFKSISGTRGVLNVMMMSGNRPAKLPDSWVEEAKELAKQMSSNKILPEIQPGNKIKFTSGPFVGMEGICQWTKKDRIGALLCLLGQQNTIKTPSEWVVKV